MTMVRRLSQPYISDVARRGQEKQTIDRHSIPANQNHDPIEQLKAAAPLWSTLIQGLIFSRRYHLLLRSTIYCLSMIHPVAHSSSSENNSLRKKCAAVMWTCMYQCIIPSQIPIPPSNHDQQHSKFSPPYAYTEPYTTKHFSTCLLILGDGLVVVFYPSAP